MSPTALTWAFASWVAKYSGFMLTSANRACPPDHARVVDQYGVLGLVSRLDKLVELVGYPLSAGRRVHGLSLLAPGTGPGRPARYPSGGRTAGKS
jgi:hypothetical protein